MRFPPRRSRWLAALVSSACAFSAWAASPLQMNNTQPLAFGRFAAGAGGTLTINPGGLRSASSGVVLVSGGVGSPALFMVSGDPGTSYRITLPAQGAVSLVSPAGQSMAVNGFASSPLTVGQLSPVSGTQTIAVGATLTVGANQPPGSYTGHFVVFIEYE
jgi:hypothetical protein